MKTIYITKGVVRYAVKSYLIESNSNYDTAIHIKMVGEKFPQWGTVIKATDNVREYAKKVIDSWVD